MLDIDEVKLGRNIVLIKARKAFKTEQEESLAKISASVTDLEGEELNPIIEQMDFVEPEVSDAMAKLAFKESIRKLEQVRHISSPILKVVFI